MSKVVSMRNVPEAAFADTQGAAKSTRVAWNGNLDKTELSRPGGLLLAALIQCANTRGETMAEMSQALGVTYGYVNQLRNGLRQTSQISDDFALSCAHYLVCPRMTVLMLAGRITPEDVFESTELVAAELPRAMRFVCDDPEGGPQVPEDVRNGSYRAQFLVVRLYETATGRQLLSQRLNLDSFAQEIAKMKALQQARREQVEAYVARKQSSDSDSSA